MTQLQKVTLGTAPLGQDGDSSRTAFGKANANVDVLNVQAALTSAPTITANQDLTQAHVGKRVNLQLPANAGVGLPPASAAGADAVIHLRNIGTVPAPIWPGAGNPSATQAAMFMLGVGESAMFDTDGVNPWKLLMRGRAGTDNATVSGSLTAGGSVMAVNGANLFPNGTGELGSSTWLTSNFGVRVDSANGGTKYGNTAAIAGGAVVQDTSLSFPLFPGPVCLQAEIFTVGSMPAGGNCSVVLDTLDSSGAVVTSTALQVGVSGPSGGFKSVTATATLAGTFTQGRIRLQTNSTVVAPVSGVQFRRIKLEAGTTPSLYSQEASVQWLQQNPTFANGANMGGKAVINVANPVNATDGANKQYVDAGLAAKMGNPNGGPGTLVRGDGTANRAMQGIFQSAAPVSNSSSVAGYEYHIPGLTALMTYILSNGVHVWGNSNGSAAVSSTRATMDTSGNLSLSGALAQASDIRIKTNVAAIPDAGTKIDALRGVTWNRIDLPDDGNRLYAGVIAQELEAVFPCGVVRDASNGSDNTGEDAILHVDSMAVIALLVESVKDLRARVASLEGVKQ